MEGERGGQKIGRNIIRLQKDWLRNLLVVQNIFYLLVTFEQKDHLHSPGHVPLLSSLPGDNTLSKVLSAKTVSGFLFWESEPGACSPKYAQQRYTVAL